MGHFDGTVEKIIGEISKRQETRKAEATRLVTTAENIFGNIGLLVGELEPALSERFSELKPSITMGSWTKAGNGATAFIRMKKAASERDIKLALEFGNPEVKINGNGVPQNEVKDHIVAAIITFFAEEKE